MRQIIIILIVGLSVFGCTRKQEDNSSATVTLSLPATFISASYKAATSSDISSYALSVNDTWGATDPTHVDEIGCYGVMVGGPEAEMSQNFCTNSQGGVEIARFGVMAGLFASNGKVEITVPSGSARRFYILGFKLGSGFCETMIGHEITKAHYSAPFLLAQKTVDLSPGEQSISMTLINTFNSSNKIDRCTFFRDPTSGASSGLAVNPPNKALGVSANYTFSATGGVPPHIFSMVSGSGTITAAGAFTAPGSPGANVIRVTDSTGATATANVDVVNLGILDVDFATSGTFIHDKSSADGVFATATQPDGKIVAVGWCADPTNKDLCVFRLNQNGSIDTGFATSGFWTYDSSSNDSAAKAVKIQADGKILIAGDCDNSPSRICLARLNADGSMDSTFAGDGFLSDDISSSGYMNSAYDLDIQSDGKIIVYGNIDMTGSSTMDYAVVRYNSDGSRDSSFNSTGLKVLDAGQSMELAYGGFLASNGKIYIAGHSYVAGYYDGIVFRLNSDGSLDTGFGSGGKYTYHVSALDIKMRDVAELSDGNIIAVGQKAGVAMITKITAAGLLDASYGSAGATTSDLIATYPEVMTDLYVQPDGKVLVSGYDTINYKTFVARYMTDGTIDSSFGTSGVTASATILAPVDTVRMSVGFDGKISYGGRKQNTDADLAVLRFTSDSN